MMEVEPDKATVKEKLPVGCAQGLVSKILKHLAEYVAKVWRSLERKIDTCK